MAVETPVSIGELIDKLTILEIKKARIEDSAKLRNIQREYALLEKSAKRYLKDPRLIPLQSELKMVNEFLWEVEDRLRDLEQEKRFDQEFIDNARLVYKTNDKRAQLKRSINNALGSRLTEEKSYRKYDS